MGEIEQRLESLGIVLPAPPQPPGGVPLPFAWVNLRGERAFVSGHGPHDPDGNFAGPFGRVGAEIGLEEARRLARTAGLGMLSSLRLALGDLDRVTGWCRVLGMVNSTPGFDRQPEVINAFSELILDVFGPEIGRHARSAVGRTGLPLGFPVEIEAEVLIRGLP